MSFIGSTIGHIRIEALIGAGGMGEVYRGFHEKLERRVAVKTIRAEHRLSGELKARFLREARLLSKLGHPGICQVYDLIETPEADFLVLEHVEGRTLKEIAADDLSFESKLQLGEKIATALAAAHRERIVHRDLKADNVMVTAEGEVKVLDFGIARSVAESGTRPIADTKSDPEPLPVLIEPGNLGDLTQHGALLGTARAMSPEQAQGGRVTMASDLYSLGILLQELFTGEPAYNGQNPVEILMQVMRAETLPVDGLDPDLARLLLDLQSLDPRRRPTAEQTAARLRWILDRPQRQRLRRLRLIAAVAAFTVLLALLAVASWQALEARRARSEADRRRKQAEDLIGFMVGDLRPKLESVGRLDLLDDVGDRALAYFNEMKESELTDDELSQRIRTILQIGEVRLNQGRLPEAFAAFQRGRDLAARLVERDPGVEAWQRSRIDAHSWIGQVEFDRGRPREALAEWRHTLDLSREQLSLHPDSEDWLDALSIAHLNVGTALDETGDLAPALRSYRESLAITRRLAEKYPGDLPRQAQLAATLAWVSNVLEGQGDLQGALAERQDHLHVFEKLAAMEPANPARRQELATARGFLAGLLAILGERAQARALYESGLATISDLAAKDSDNAALQRWLAAFHGAIGALDEDSFRALGHLKSSREILTRLLAQDATNADWRFQLGLCHRRLASALVERDPAAARREAHRALEILHPLVEEVPDELTRGQIAEAEIVLGTAEENPREARVAWERALAALAPCRRPLTHWKLVDPWARALFALDRAEEARPAVERLRRMGYVGLSDYNDEKRGISR
ncbi:MAG: eukaryotic-like serine/threonine-protein kinase [Acidobacteriota bacterium]|nr:eukaryotic-like serine/threonine-protein kinase [Acidobacteriota bacterium]